MVGLVPREIVEPFAGLVMLIVGAEPADTVTLTTALSVRLPNVSVAIAVKAWVPFSVGCHVTEYGNAFAVPRLRPLSKISTEAMVPLMAVATAVTVWVVPTGLVAAATGE